jgi:hypothetical protein
VLIAAPAPLTCAFSRIHGKDHAVTLFPSLHVSTDFLDRAAEFMAQHKWRLDSQPSPRPVVRPEMPVCTADAVSSNTQNRTVRWALWVWDILHYQRSVQFFDHGGSHAAPFFVNQQRISRGRGILEQVANKGSLPWQDDRESSIGMLHW